MLAMAKQPLAVGEVVGEVSEDINENTQFCFFVQPPPTCSTIGLVIEGR